jgi:hypothetical protein
VIGPVLGHPCFVQGMFEDRGSQTSVADHALSALQGESMARA